MLWFPLSLTKLMSLDVFLHRSNRFGPTFKDKKARLLEDASQNLKKEVFFFFYPYERNVNIFILILNFKNKIKVMSDLSHD